MIRRFEFQKSEIFDFNSSCMYDFRNSVQLLFVERTAGFCHKVSAKLRDLKMWYLQVGCNSIHVSNFRIFLTNLVSSHQCRFVTDGWTQIFINCNIKLSVIYNIQIICIYRVNIYCNKIVSRGKVYPVGIVIDVICILSNWLFTMRYNKPNKWSHNLF